MKCWKSYTLITGVACVLALVISFIVNTLVNPLRTTPHRWSLRSLEPYQEISAQMRSGKAGIVRSGNWDVILCGSSRVGNCLNPKNPAWGKRRVANLGLSGGYLYETAAMARYALVRENPRLSIIAIDPGDLSSVYDSRPHSDFSSSPLAGRENSLNRELRYHIGIPTFELSIRTLAAKAAGRLANHTPEGLRIRNLADAGENQLEFLERSLRVASEAGAGGELADPAEPGLRVQPAKRAALEELLAAFADRKAPVILIYLPRHALVHARSAEKAAPPVHFENERRALVEIVESVNRTSPGPAVRLWDFHDYHPLNCEPIPENASRTMEYWMDLEHYTLKMGDLILSRVMDWPTPIQGGENYGTPLTSANLEARIADVRAGYSRYLSSPDGEADTRFKETLLRDALAKRP